jgi:hypothetical protein
MKLLPATTSTATDARKRAREERERERRRLEIARLRFEGGAMMPSPEISRGLAALPEPIIASERTIARDLAHIRQHADKYLSVENFPKRLEVFDILHVFDLAARTATKRMVDERRPDAAAWAMASLRAAQQKAELLFKTGLIDRRDFERRHRSGREDRAHPEF